MESEKNNENQQDVNKIMVGVRLDNPPIILMPLDENEIEQYAESFASLYLLYKDVESGQISIGIPSMQRYSPSVGNMYGSEKSNEKKYFYNGGSELESQVDKIDDRPIYEIYPSDDRTVAGYQVLGGIQIRLEDVLCGIDKIEKGPTK